MRSKKLNAGCGITIPKDIRAAIGLTAHMAVDIECADGGINIKKHLPTCRFCGSVEGVITHCDEDICTACIKKLSEEAANYDGQPR